uniref:Uncharacterized protein n=1 Tax=mine drainage metagenome TaxID=410659 RepID=E6QNQ7_9ZZZZ
MLIFLLEVVDALLT